MGGAQAEPYSYGMENNYKKSNGKDVSVNSIKCNNVNVNVNGLELNVLPPALSNLLASEAQESDEGKRGASSYGSGGGSYGSGQSGSDKDFKFICINNNNNTVVGVDEDEEPPTPIPPVVPTCAAEIELCFSDFLDDTQFTALVNALDEGVISITIGPGVTVVIDDFGDICRLLQALGVTEALIQHFLFEIFLDIPAIVLPPGNLPATFLDCVEAAIEIEL